MDSEGPRVIVALGNAALFGQERENIEVLRAARAAGVEALFVTNAVWGHHAIEPYLDRLGLRWERLRYAWHFRYSLPRREWLPNVARLATASRRFLRMMKAFRATHIQVANLHYALCILPALWATRTPLVYRLGDVPTVHHALYRHLWRVILPRTARFVCVSEFIQREIITLGARPDQTEVVYALPPERPAIDGDGGVPADLRVELDGPRFTGRTLLFLGEVGEHKGIHLLVEAVGALAQEGHEIRLLVAGQYKGASESAFARDLATRAMAVPRRADGAQHVRFLGYVEDVESVLRLADVHAAPSICEDAAPLVVLEAKRAGVPSVVFPAGGLPEFVRTPGLDGIVCASRTVPALVDGLRHFVTMDDASLAASGAAARASLADLGGTPEQFAAAWRRIYDETARAPYAAA